jgi:hypothetical protein
MAPAEQQAYILSALPARAREKGMRVWKLEDGIPTRGRRFLIGVTEYSRRDLNLLDGVCGTLKGNQLDMFILSQCKSQSEIEDYVAGIGPVYHSPVVGVWEDGRLTASVSGWKKVVQLLARVWSRDPVHGTGSIFLNCAPSSAGQADLVMDIYKSYSDAA